MTASGCMILIRTSSHFSKHLGLRWYGLAYLAAFVSGALLIIFLAKRGRGTIRPDAVPDFITAIVLGTMIGGRVGYAVFYAPELLTTFDHQAPYWRLLKVWEGGMASHGGIVGIVLAAAFFAWRRKMNWLHLIDLTTLGGSIGVFCGRIANFINGELFGREAPASFPVRVKFPGEALLWLRHDMASGADQLNGLKEAAAKLGYDETSFTQMIQPVKDRESSQFQIKALIDRIIAGIDGGNLNLKAALAPALTPRYPSQLIEAFLEGLVLFLIAFFFWRKPRKPGVVAAVFLFSYAVVRIIGEQFRMPDAQIGFDSLGLTRGQWLSIVTMLFASGLFYYAWSRKTPVIGGWGAQARKLKNEEPLPTQGTMP